MVKQNEEQRQSWGGVSPNSCFHFHPAKFCIEGELHCSWRSDLGQINILRDFKCLIDNSQDVMDQTGLGPEQPHQRRFKHETGGCDRSKKTVQKANNTSTVWFVWKEEVVFCDTGAAYLRHIIQAIEDVLASLLGLNPCFTLMVLGSLEETRSRCSSQIPSHFPPGNTLFTFGSLQPLVVDVQQDSAYPRSNPGVAQKYSSNSQERRCWWLYINVSNIWQTRSQHNILVYHLSL